MDLSTGPEHEGRIGSGMNLSLFTMIGIGLLFLFIFLYRRVGRNTECGQRWGTEQTQSTRTAITLVQRMFPYLVVFSKTVML
jgi:hypothetical protein